MKGLYVILLALLSFSASGQSSPIILGHTDTISSAVLGEKRLVNIYLPEGYSPDSAARYPVIYLLDGALDEDFIHMAGLVQFASFPWVKHLPPSILVGIANTERRRDFTFPAEAGFKWPDFAVPFKETFANAGGSAKFMDFVEKELQLYIAQNYKTSGWKTLIGQSLGGLMATEILLKRPALFNDYIIVSPSLWWDNESLLKKAPSLVKSFPRTPMHIYIAVGKEGEMMEADARSLSKLLKDANRANIHVLFEYLPREDHGTILHQAAMNAFRGMHNKP